MEKLASGETWQQWILLTCSGPEEKSINADAKNPLCGASLFAMKTFSFDFKELW